MECQGPAGECGGLLEMVQEIIHAELEGDFEEEWGSCIVMRRLPRECLGTARRKTMPERLCSAEMR